MTWNAIACDHSMELEENHEEADWLMTQEHTHNPKPFTNDYPKPFFTID